MVRNNVTARFLSFVLLLFPFQVQAGFAQSAPASPNSNLSEERKIIQELGLTREQIEKLASLSQNLVSPTGILARDLNKAQQKLDQLLASSSASVGEIRDQYRRVELIRQAIYRLDVEYRIGLRDVLTPEQRPKYEGYIRQQVEQSQPK